MIKRSIVMKTTDMQNTTIQSAATQNSNMLNKLHMAMIELYKGDAKRIQHFCKVHSYARLIAQMENVDEKTLFTIETAALTHDIGIHISKKNMENVVADCRKRKDLHLLKSFLKNLI